LLHIDASAEQKPRSVLERLHAMGPQLTALEKTVRQAEAPARRTTTFDARASAPRDTAVDQVAEAMAASRAQRRDLPWPLLPGATLIPCGARGEQLVLESLGRTPHNTIMSPRDAMDAGWRMGEPRLTLQELVAHAPRHVSEAECDQYLAGVRDVGLRLAVKLALQTKGMLTI
jgi:hypothetical protein